VRIDLAPGVAELVRRLGESSITVELTLDFEHDVMKTAVAFPGPSEPSLGYQLVHADGVDVWWRQRIVLGTRAPQVTARVRPRQLRVRAVGRALAASADYA
jgi:hypothetical protein